MYLKMICTASILMLFSGAFATEMKCMNIQVENASYMYCPSNNTLYTPASISAKRLSAIKDKINNLKDKNKQQESTPKSSPSSGVKAE